MTKNGRIDVIGLNSITKSGATDAANIGADIEQIKLYLAPINPDMIVADIGDSGDKVAKLIEYYGEERVFGCQYNSSPHSNGQMIPMWNENSNMVKVDKLVENKKYISMLKEGMIYHPKRPSDRRLNDYLVHWKNVVIRDEEDEKTSQFRQVIGRRGDDHKL